VLKNIARKEEQEKQMQQQQQQLEKDRLEHEKQQRKRRRWDVGDENDSASVSETPRYTGADATPAYGGIAGTHLRFQNVYPNQNIFSQLIVLSCQVRRPLSVSATLGVKHRCRSPIESL
jgi:hypothetical protein